LFFGEVEVHGALKLSSEGGQAVYANGYGNAHHPCAGVVSPGDCDRRPHQTGDEGEKILAKPQADPPPAKSQSGWPDRIHAIFKRNRITQVGYVPDTGHARLIALCQEDNEITDVVLTSEAEGPALVLGAALGGQRAALLMQSSGVGNCINTFSLLRNCAVPCVILVTMRGEFNDFNPWQVPMGSITEPVLELCGFLTNRVEREEDIDDIIESGCRMAFGGNMQVAILLSQRMLERYKPEGH
jgi:sulfopyruvate decarboxylase TPP-binding subunit